MYAYCVGELRMSEDSAFKRIRAARAARRFPSIFAAVADGRLHVSTVVVLAPCLTEATAVELLAAAAHKTKSEVEQLVAQRFPRRDLPTVLEAVSSAPSPASFRQLAPGPVATIAPGQVETPTEQLSPGIVEALAPVQIAPIAHPRVTPLAPERFALQVTIGQSTHDKLRYAQELLSHQIPAGDLAQVLDRVLDLAIEQLEKRKFAATSKPRPEHRRSSEPSRHVPAEVMRAVWERDHGQCTFVSDAGHRCPARTLVEFDHIDEVARGGRATIGGMRLRCRAHNQYTAERTFGTEFMRHKRQDAAARRAETARREAFAADARASTTAGARPSSFSLQAAARPADESHAHR
jgi:hypothetical protein